MKLIKVTRDKTCNYCNMSEYREHYDGRDFYSIHSDRLSGSMIIQVCEFCLQNLYVKIGVILREWANITDG